MNALGPFDYGYIPRAGTTVAYYNAGYVLALGQASEIARWLLKAGAITQRLMDYYTAEMQHKGTKAPA